MIKKHWTNLGRALCLRSEVSVKSLLSQKKADKTGLSCAVFTLYWVPSRGRLIKPDFRAPRVILSGTEWSRSLRSWVKRTEQTEERSDEGISKQVLLFFWNKSNICFEKTTKFHQRSRCGFALRFCSFAFSPHLAKVRLAIKIARSGWHTEMKLERTIKGRRLDDP